MTDGIVVSCDRCKCEVLLPYTSKLRGAVWIDHLDGWTAPPARCPECSAEEAKERASDA